MSSQTLLFDVLQKEFCPPLDSSLLAALLADLDFDTSEGSTASPSRAEVNNLRTTLQELAEQAQSDESQLSDALQATSASEENSSSLGFSKYTTPSATSISSNQNGTSREFFSSPLGFLQASMPHIPTEILSSALADANGVGEVDMWEIIAGILSEECIRELEERGLDALDIGSPDGNVHDEELSWETVEKKKRPKHSKAPGKGREIRSEKYVLGDVHRRQQPDRSSNIRPTSCIPPPSIDPWTQLSSISSHAAMLLPPHPPSYFQSYFHSPTHPTPYHALVAAIEAIIAEQKNVLSDEYITVLFNLLDLLLPEHETLSSEQKSHLFSDAELAVKATLGRENDALDLINLLRGLETDFTNGYFNMGVYHSPSTKTLNPPLIRPKDDVLHHNPNLPSGPPDIRPPPSLNVEISSSNTSKSNPFHWQTVPQRKFSTRSSYLPELYIPTYTRNVNGIKVRGSGNGSGKGDVGELDEFKYRMNESMRKRRELLREATRMWQRGNAKTRGGEVAYYFAERAREFQELARQEALSAARAMVRSKRLTSPDQDTIDVHGTTVYEAIVIVKEILRDQGSSQTKPLKIITGRGTHSVNQVSVLKPAIRKALVEDGWFVGTWDGGLVVRGRQAA